MLFVLKDMICNFLFNLIKTIFMNQQFNEGETFNYAQTTFLGAIAAACFYVGGIILQIAFGNYLSQENLLYHLGIYTSGAMVLACFTILNYMHVVDWLEKQRALGLVPRDARGTVFHFGWRIFVVALLLSVSLMALGLLEHGFIPAVMVGACLLLADAGFAYWLVVEDGRRDKTASMTDGTATS